VIRQTGADGIVEFACIIPILVPLTIWNRIRMQNSRSDVMCVVMNASVSAVQLPHDPNLAMRDRLLLGLDMRDIGSIVLVIQRITTSSRGC
jgi:hypothetical protein